jgi:hypothetical protein
MLSGEWARDTMSPPLIRQDDEEQKRRCLTAAPDECVRVQQMIALR